MYIFIFLLHSYSTLFFQYSIRFFVFIMDLEFWIYIPLYRLDFFSVFLYNNEEIKKEICSGGSMKTVLYLVRHGESLGNLEGRTLGHTDRDLSALGYSQANATFEYMKDVHLDAVYSSPLMRAMHTVQPHADHRGLKVIPMDALKEIYLGKWENMSVTDIVHRWPYTFTEIWRANFGVSTPPKGEYAQDCADRVMAALTEIAETHPGQTVLIGGHGGIFRLAFARIASIAPERVGAETAFMSNASITKLIYENGSFSVVYYSKDEHLASVGITKLTAM